MSDISSPSDVDWFGFAGSAGTISFNVTPAVRSANLDLLVELRDSAGNLLASANPADALPAAISYAAPLAGSFYLTVRGTGKGDPLNGGYSNYGSVVRSSSSSFESLSIKVNSLESTVSDLSNLLAIEFKGLREEVNFLRTLVYQQHQQQQQQHQRRPAFEHRQSHERETASPLLTLRSPSPHHPSPAFPQPIPLSRGNSYQGAGSGGSNHANSTLLAASTFS